MFCVHPSLCPIEVKGPRQRLRFRAAWIGLGVLLSGGGLNVAGSEGAGAPLLKDYCFQCHNAEKRKGGINLEQLSTEDDFARNFERWELVAEMVEAREMPPEGERQPADSERRALADWVKQRLNADAAAAPGDPGPVVMRRLTSAEYAYAIEDLTGLRTGLERTFNSDAVGGEGFANVGEVQFMQDSVLERYLDAARTVASHAVVGAGPLRFYPDPGKTGLELSAIRRIQEIYREHGFRTAAGEGGEPFGLDKYPKAFHAAWRFQHRVALGLPELTMAASAKAEGLEPRFVQHIHDLLNRPEASFPISEIVNAWKRLPVPSADSPVSVNDARAACEALYAELRRWQSTLAETAGDDEEAPVLTDGAFEVVAKHAFRMNVDWPKGARTGSVWLAVRPAIAAGGIEPSVRWRNARLRFRGADRRFRETRTLAELLTEESKRLAGIEIVEAAQGDGEENEAPALVTSGWVELELKFQVPEGASRAVLTVQAELDVARSGDALVRCEISDGQVEGETAASTGGLSVLLANPASDQLPVWQAGVKAFAHALPEVSQREPAPSDRDPIPPPFDNTYNSEERNFFHYRVKYHRDDRFFVEFLADEATRRALDQAWADLLLSFEYHDTYLRFAAEKAGVDWGQRSIELLDEKDFAGLPKAVSDTARRLWKNYRSARDAFHAAEDGHVEDVVEFAARAWRRPIRSSEAASLREFYGRVRAELELSHADAIRAMIARVLVSPGFLYRAEFERETVEGNRAAALSEWELAGRLSFFLWSSVPDAELRRAAEAGELRSPGGIERQARRMLKDEKARRFAAEFFGQWFGFYRFDEFGGVDAARFPEFDAELKAAMYEEAVSFFDHVVREDRPVDEILFADYSFLNERLAEHYGVALAVNAGEGLTRVEGVGAAHRGGLLRLGVVHAITSAPLRTSAVKRGDWILRRVLGTPVPPPPPDAGSIPAEEVLADGRTVRERLEAHRRDSSCVNCHSRMDPLGFALENFDVIGRWRDAYGDGLPIDSSGTLNDGTLISGPDGLRDYLRRQRQNFYRTLCTKLLGYALGRGDLISDRPLIEQMIRTIEEGGRFPDLVMQVVASRQFRHRRAGEVLQAEVLPE